MQFRILGPVEVCYGGRALDPGGLREQTLLPVRVSDDLFFAVVCVDDPDKGRRALGGLPITIS